jgi:hypothetical protein
MRIGGSLLTDKVVAGVPEAQSKLWKLAAHHLIRGNGLNTSAFINASNDSGYTRIKRAL